MLDKLLKQNIKHMKKTILTSLFFCCFGYVLMAQYEFASYKPSEDNTTKQNLYFEVRSAYMRPVKKDELGNAQLLREVIPGYPINWITDYVEVEIATAKGNFITRTKSKNEKLTAEQKKLLASASIGTDIIVDVKYSFLHPVTKQRENNTIHTTVTVAPDNEAMFLGVVPGYNALHPGNDALVKKYLEENCIRKVLADIPEKFQKGTVKFTVNENGEAVNARIVMPSGNDKMDKMLLDAVMKMPKWKPAQNSKGENVPQEFDFVVGTGC